MNKRIEMLLEACDLIKKNDDEQANKDLMIVSMAQTAYQLGYADGTKKKDEQ